MRDDRRLKLLLFAHLAGGLAVTGCALVMFPQAYQLDIYLVPLVALLLCQACLLGMWAAFSESKPLRRVVVLVSGGFYLDVLLAVGIQEWPFFLMPSLTSIVVAGILFRLQGSLVEFRRFTGTFPQPDQERLRFSIRGLMLFTVVVALVAAGFRSLAGILEQPWIWAALTVWSLCFVAVCLAASWAALGLGRPSWRILVVLAFTAVVGALFSVTVGPNRWQTWFYILTIMVLELVGFLGSLLVVRSCGYRLIGVSSFQKGVEDEVVFIDGDRSSEISSLDVPEISRETSF